ncbi:MAG: hypothetical protein K2Y31_04900 [Burkholderiales bacterium]|jgi:hypothetical protein|nr:hypothetical protein [Burkholderiales bacterium]
MTPPSEKYDLLLTGRILPGHKREVVAAALAKLMRISEAQALELLSGREQTVKGGLELAAMGRYVRALRDAGVETRAELAIAGAMMDCPCCRKRSLKQRGAGELCRVCGWRDDAEQNESCPDQVIPGRNWGYSLAQAQKQFAERGSLEPLSYVPNVVPLKKRITETLVTLLVLAYCGYSLWRDALFIPNISRNQFGSVPSFTLHGVEAWLVSGALLFGVLQFFVPVIDHYDKRNNEALSEKIALICRVLMFVFLALWLGANIYLGSGGDLRVLAVLVVVGVVLLVMGIKVYKNRNKYQ